MQRRAHESTSGVPVQWPVSVVQKPLGLRQSEKIPSKNFRVQRLEIESDCFDDMENVIIEGFAKGRTPAAISNEIQRRFDVTKSKANLLARDQVGTLSANLTRTRQESAGVEEYIWSSSGDERVRECHRELDGQKFRYDDPPAMWYMTKHGKVYSGRHCNPGEDYQCRCVAKPVFNFDRLNSAAFKEKKQ